MKIKYNKQYILMALSTFAMLFFGCVKEPPISVYVELEVTSQEPHKAGKKVNFQITGEGEMFSIFPGDEGHEWSNYPQATGYTLTEYSFEYLYSRGGEFDVVCIVSSYGNWGDDLNRVTSQQTIVVIDDRTILNRIRLKSINVGGMIDNENKTITFSVAPDDDLTNVLVTFTPASPDAIVYYGDQVVEDGVSIIDFTNDVVLTVVAPNGDEAYYQVIIVVE